MRELAPEGEKLVAEIARREQVSVDAVKTLLEAVARGGGTMAQFSHPELGGSGQWLRGGMTMIGDMFNDRLKAKVDAICTELSGFLANAPDMAAPSGSHQSQYQGTGPIAGSGPMSSLASSSGGSWWPAEFGSPASSGAQNNMRYAYFPEKRRLVLERAGRIEVFDTGEHIIAGFGQQQGAGNSLTLNSQLGTVSLDRLPRVALGGGTTSKPVSGGAGGTSPSSSAPASQSASHASTDPASTLTLIERMAELRDKGLLSEEEFAAKKAELLKRI